VSRVAVLAAPAVALASAGTLALAPGATLARTAPARHYAGHTSEGLPISLTLAPGGRQITGFATTLALTAACGGHTHSGFRVGAARIDVGRGGAFTRHVALVLGGIRNHGVISGRVTSRAVSGTVAELVGTQLNACYQASFSLRR
jgi:hypothetical protein